MIDINADIISYKSLRNIEIGRNVQSYNAKIGYS